MTHRLSPEDPRLLPFLPALYIAWADGDLHPDELESICSALDPDCRTLIASWLDPDDPPSAAELARTLHRIRRTASGMERREKIDLVGLGLALAQADGEVARVERQALENLQGALGVDGTEAARQLLATRRPARRQPEPEPTFDLAAMTAVLEPDYAALRERVFELLGREPFRYLYDVQKDDYRERVLAWCRILADEGFGALSYPAGLPYADGLEGADDIGAFVATFETLCFFDLSLVVKFGVQFGLFGGSILNLGTERHHRDLLPRVASLELPGCFAMTETSHGSNVADLETTAHFDRTTDEFIIDTPHEGARKDYIGNAARHGRMATVFAQLILDEGGEPIEHGVHAFLVPLRDEQGAPLPGVHLEDDGPKLGLNGVDNGRIGFDQVRVPRANLLDRFATVAEDGSYESPIASPSKRFFTMLGTLVGGRVAIASGSLSATKSALTIAVRYGRSRRQFGPNHVPETKLLDYPTHQRRLMPRLARTYALQFALHDLRRRYADSDPLDRREIEVEAAGLKALATWHATDTIQVCRECCGGQGYLAANRFAALKADTDVFTTFEGDNMVLLQLVAKSLLGGLKRQFGQMSPIALLRYIAGRAASAVAERNPLTTRLTSDEHLLDREFQLSALAFREHHLLVGVARDLKSRLGGGASAASVIRDCQEQLVATARAHVEHRIAVRFAEIVRAQDDDALRSILGRLADLHVLAELSRDRAFFLETGYFEPTKATAVHQLVLRLAAEVREQALPLVDAFAIPDDLLAAPIAR